MDVVDRVRLSEHRARVAASLDALEGFFGYTTAHLKAHQGGRVLLALDPDLLVSVALVTVAGLRGWPSAPGDSPASWPSTSSPGAPSSTRCAGAISRGRRTRPSSPCARPWRGSIKRR